MSEIWECYSTRKTFLCRTLCAAIRSREEIVLLVASSGIIASLLPRGRTTHSIFQIPNYIGENSVLPSVRPGADLTALLLKTKLIIWDEAPMTHKFCFEALDNTGLLEDSYMPFGGKVVVLGGDLRQILPLVPKGSVLAAISSSYLWNHCKVLRLTRNMRLQVGNCMTEARELQEFSEWVLKVGDGNVGGQNDGEAEIQFPQDILIKESADRIASIVERTYPSLLDNLSNAQYFRNRIILAPTPDIVDIVNDYILSFLPGQERVYLSSDEIIEEERDSGGNVVSSTEVLNTMRCTGLPNHVIRLKVGATVMLIRDMGRLSGLCSDTRLLVTGLSRRVIRATIITGRNNDESVLTPRITLTPSNAMKFPMKFERRQFSLNVSFAMTINKSHGQSLSHVGLYLPRAVFNHGQIYVAISRVTRKTGLKVLILDRDKKIFDTTIYKEIFQNL